jgi:hypothetical protein
MQAVDGPNSSQLEWHQIGVKTNGPNSSQLEWHQDGVRTRPRKSLIRPGPVQGTFVSIFYQFTPLVRNRDVLLERLNEAGVPTEVDHPILSS